MENKPSSYRLADYFLCITSSLPAEEAGTKAEQHLALEIAYRYPATDYPDTRMQWASIPLVFVSVSILSSWSRSAFRPAKNAGTRSSTSSPSL